jgi:hypothetical protein
VLAVLTNPSHAIKSRAYINFIIAIVPSINIKQNKMSHEQIAGYDKVRTNLPLSEPEVLSMAGNRPTARGRPDFSSLMSGSETGCEYTGTVESGLEKVVCRSKTLSA